VIRQASPLAPETSDAIRIARVLCIVSMVSVHVWPGATEVLAAESPFHWLYLVVVEYLGRGSVPLLSIVSGVLLTVSARKGKPGSLVASKARSLLHPMVVWSALLLALLVAHAIASGDRGRLPHTTLGWINSVFALTAEPINVPLAFLRDVFVSVLIGLVALQINKRSFAACVVFLVAVAALEYTLHGVLLLRPQIFIFFAAGVLISLTGQTRFVPAIPLVVAALFADILVRRYLEGDIGGYTNRVAMSLFIWRCAIELSRRRNRLTDGIRALEPHIFVIFCSHMITVTFVAALGKALHLQPADPAFLLFWLGQFPAIILVGIAISVLGEKLGVMRFLVGSRA
jgi:hypothetical protein